MNPYAPPVSNVAAPHQALLEYAASGRRIANLCMFSWLAATAFRVDRTSVFSIYFVGYLVASIVGGLRLTEGLGIFGVKRFLLVVGCGVPILGLLPMAWLSTRSGRLLRSAGYQVGLFISTKGRMA
jgi:hypothetical protein